MRARGSINRSFARAPNRDKRRGGASGVQLARGRRRQGAGGRGEIGGTENVVLPRRTFLRALRQRRGEVNPMKFGIFYEISVPRHGTPTTEKRVYDNCLEQVMLADELGFDQVWAVEHHFLEEYSHCSAPEIFLSACAMSTKKIRVGHGIAVCVPQFNHPVRLAERAAVLDIVSNGRLEFGTGRSATWTELGGFQASPDR